MQGKGSTNEAAAAVSSGSSAQTQGVSSGYSAQTQGIQPAGTGQGYNTGAGPIQGQQAMPGSYQ